MIQTKFPVIYGDRDERQGLNHAWSQTNGDDQTGSKLSCNSSMSSDFNNVTVDRVSAFSLIGGMLLTFALDIFVVRPEEFVSILLQQ